MADFPVTQQPSTPRFSVKKLPSLKYLATATRCFLFYEVFLALGTVSGFQTPRSSQMHKHIVTFGVLFFSAIAFNSVLVVRSFSGQIYSGEVDFKGLLFQMFVVIGGGYVATKHFMLCYPSLCSWQNLEQAKRVQVGNAAVRPSQMYTIYEFTTDAMTMEDLQTTYTMTKKESMMGTHNYTFCATPITANNSWVIDENMTFWSEVIFWSVNVEVEPEVPCVTTPLTKKWRTGILPILSDEYKDGFNKAVAAAQSRSNAPLTSSDPIYLELTHNVMKEKMMYYNDFAKNFYIAAVTPAALLVVSILLFIVSVIVKKKQRDWRRNNNSYRQVQAVSTSPWDRISFT